jgi:uncharacterized protein YndB with AHSA1/START domain
MEPPRWLAPLTGAIAFGSSAAMVGVYAYGLSLPEEHAATVRAEIPVPAEQVWALLTDLKKRATWRPHVAKVGRIEDVSGHEVWRELDAREARFDFIVLENAFPRLTYATARPEDIGMSAEWTWTVTPQGDHAVVEVHETGRIENQLVRAWWGIEAGPYQGIEPDLRGFATALGSPDVPIERR